VIRARAKITSHFGISSPGHLRQILKSKNLEIVHYYCVFCFLKSTEPNLNLSAKNVNLFLREPLMERPNFGLFVQALVRKELYEERTSKTDFIKRRNSSSYPKNWNWGVRRNKLSESAKDGLDMGCQNAKLF
jgi:hypothetical protein